METNKSENKQQLTGLKKRQQIAQANKMIFVWVIVASVAISFCAVTAQFLFRQATFNQKIISAKAEAQKTLTNNLNGSAKLKDNVNELLANTNLSRVKANPSDSTLKVVLDALPTSDDKSALGASLQQVILPKSDVKTTDLTTISQDGSNIASTLTTSADASISAQTTNFSFVTTGNYDKLKIMLKDIERTIRPINLQNIDFKATDTDIKTTVSGVSYYLPERTVELGKRTIKP